MKAVFAIVAFVTAASCGSSSSHQHVQLTKLSFDVPGDWTHTESKGRGIVTSVWTPSEGNDRRESITIVRSELSPAVANAGVSTLDRLLTSAQASLHDAKISSVTQTTTTNGLAGARIETDYVPPELHVRYHRVHVVLVDGSALVNVLYTARDPDANLAAFNLVLSTIRHEES
ncbi:MAG: hypothetical protein JWO36_3547 [Myxococcales bacterium]|nr:hypothetical protein [Myxococcales bacterium]